MSARLQQTVTSSDITSTTDRKWNIGDSLSVQQLVIRRWRSDDSLTHSPWTHLRTCRNRFCGSARSHPVGRGTTPRSGPWFTLGSRGCPWLRPAAGPYGLSSCCLPVSWVDSEWSTSGELLPVLGGWRSRFQSRTDRAVPSSSLGPTTFSRRVHRRAAASVGGGPEWGVWDFETHRAWAEPRTGCAVRKNE